MTSRADLRAPAPDGKGKEPGVALTALRTLVDASIQAYGPTDDSDLDEEDISLPASGITFGMLRGARTALSAIEAETADLKRQLDEAGDALKAAKLATTTEAAGRVTRDWTALAKSAGRHGVRYRTNASLEAFLSEISSTAALEAAGRVTDEAVEAALAAYFSDPSDPVWPNDFGGDSPDQMRKDMRAALEAALPHMPAGRWQPIETAPRDGTRIDVWAHWPERGVSRRTADARWSGLGWVLDGFEDRQYTHPPVVTHWMPLPPAPSEKGGR